MLKPPHGSNAYTYSCSLRIETTPLLPDGLSVHASSINPSSLSPSDDGERKKHLKKSQVVVRSGDSEKPHKITPKEELELR